MIIPLTGKGPIHAHGRGGVDDAVVKTVIRQIQTVLSLKDLVNRG